MRMSYVADKFTGFKALIMGIASEVLVMVFSGAVMVYGGIAITKLTMTQVTASLGVSMAIIYVVVPISGVLIMIYNVLNIAHLIKEYKK